MFPISFPWLWVASSHVHAHQTQSECEGLSSFRSMEIFLYATPCLYADSLILSAFTSLNYKLCLLNSERLLVLFAFLCCCCCFKAQKLLGKSMGAIITLTLFVSLPSETSGLESRSVVSDCLQSHGLQSPWNSPGQNTGVGSLFLLQGISPTQGSNQGLLHCKWILYKLSYQFCHQVIK